MSEHALQTETHPTGHVSSSNGPLSASKTIAGSKDTTGDALEAPGGSQRP
jgi:hypothetical protein